jgi:acyl carrier protein
MIDKKINTKVLNLINSALKIKNKIDDIKIKINDIREWDSLSNIRVIMDIEKKFNMKFKLDEIEEVKTIEDLIKLIKSNQN